MSGRGTTVIRDCTCGTCELSPIAHVFPFLKPRGTSFVDFGGVDLRLATIFSCDNNGAVCEAVLLYCDSAVLWRILEMDR